MNFRPLGNRVVIRRDIAATLTPGGLHLPNVAVESPDTGLIVAIGQGRRTDDGLLVPPPVQVGDRVMLSKFAGDELGGSISDPDYPDATFLVADAGAILGVLETPPGEE